MIPVVITGRAGMPRFKDILTDEELAAVLSYARNCWGNRAEPINAAPVRQVRESIIAQTEDVEHRTE